MPPELFHNGGILALWKASRAKPWLSLSMEDACMAFDRKYAMPMAIATAMAVVTLATPLAFAQTADASGEVRRVDPAAGKVTIKHDEIKALDLPAMTLVYEADPPALLAKIKAGDKVRFTATRKDGKYVVTAIAN